MKVYKFFKIPDKELDNPNDRIEERYQLYAMTNNKEYAKRFKNDRNMKKFIYKVDKHITKEEYAELSNYDRGTILELVKVRTIFNNNHTAENSTHEEILMTFYESQMLSDMESYFESEEYWRDQPYPLIFKKKYVKALDALQYVKMYKLINMEYTPHKYMNKLSEYCEDDYSGPSFTFDEAAKFITIISDTL